MDIICSLVSAIMILLKNVYGGYPITNPYSNSNATQDYNLIDTNPSCFYQGICNMFPPGGKFSVFPNSEERFQHVLYNLFRLHPNHSMDTPLGEWADGSSTGGGPTTYCQSQCGYCGLELTNQLPIYWCSDANQMARFKQWDSYHCDQLWYNQSGQNQFSTCKWGKSVITTSYLSQQYKTGTNRCALFGTIANLSSSPTNPRPFNDDCTFLGRANKFCHDVKDSCWFDAETHCFGNSCFGSRFCDEIFAAKNDYVGIGYIENMTGATSVYSRMTRQIQYPLPSAAHYDERMRLIPSNYNNMGKYFVLMLQYYNFIGNAGYEQCYALFDETYTLMTTYIDYSQHSVIFSANFVPPTECKPYSFLCKVSNNEYYRLPQDPDYYFATEWMDIKSHNASDLGLNCKENHYFYDNITGAWIVNGGSTVSTNDIWYYQDSVNYGSCIGCKYIPVLDCWTGCILSNFDPSECICSFITTTVEPTKKPTYPPKWEECISDIKLFDVDAEGSMSIDIDQAKRKMRMTINGPQDKWFGIGFGNSVMKNTYAITISGESNIDVIQRKLANHTAGDIQIDIFDDLTKMDIATKRYVSIIRDWKVDGNENVYDFTDFFECKINWLPIIWSRGIDFNFGFHGNYKSNVLGLISCLCDDTNNTLDPLNTMSTDEYQCPIGCLLYSIDSCNQCWCNDDGEFTSCSNRPCNDTIIYRYCEECNQNQKECDDGTFVDRALEVYCDFNDCPDDSIDIHGNHACYHIMSYNKFITCIVFIVLFLF